MKLFTAMVIVLALAISSATYAADEGSAPKEGSAAKEAPKPAAAPAEKAKAPQAKLETPSAKLSYALGMEVGASLKGLEADLDMAAFVRGLEDTINDRKPLLSRQEAIAIQQAFMQKKQEERAREMKTLGDKNQKEAKVWLEENGKKEGVVTTESGLQYMVLTEGGGAKPKATDMVTVHYRGTLIDETEFDSSYNRGTPATFQLNRVIAGWTEGLQLMSEGSKYRFFIPSNLAYKESGSPPVIGPNATLIFEVELLNIGQ